MRKNKNNKNQKQEKREKSARKDWKMNVEDVQKSGCLVNGD